MAFSVPGLGGLSVLLLDRVVGAGMGVEVSPPGGPHLAKRITSLRLASRPLSVHQKTLSLGGWGAVNEFSQ